MILVDYLNVATASIFKAMHTGHMDELSTTFLLGKIRTYNAEFRSEFGELVICSDHRSWRKDEFEHYKARRVHSETPSQETQDLFRIRDEVYDALVAHSPYRCVKVPGAEGDDVMYQLSRHPGKHMIVSKDKDMSQLVSKRVRQWDPIKKQEIDNGPGFLKRLIMHGDGGDDIPNFISDDDTFVNPSKRQRPITGRIRKFIAETIDPMVEFDYLKVKGVTSEQMRANWKRNEVLIDLKRTPRSILDSISDEFHRQQNKKGDLISLFTELRAGNFLSKSNDFVPNKTGVEATHTQLDL